MWSLHSGPLFQPNQALATDGGLRGSAPSGGGRQESSIVGKNHLAQDEIGPTKSSASSLFIPAGGVQQGTESYGDTCSMFRNGLG